MRAGRYNQHVGTPSLLVEVGHNENTLAEALRTAQALAEGVGRLIRGPAGTFCVTLRGRSGAGE